MQAIHTKKLYVSAEYLPTPLEQKAFTLPLKRNRKGVPRRAPGRSDETPGYLITLTPYISNIKPINYTPLEYLKIRERYKVKPKRGGETVDSPSSSTSNTKKRMRHRKKKQRETNAYSLSPL